MYFRKKNKNRQIRSLRVTALNFL